VSAKHELDMTRIKRDPVSPKGTAICAKKAEAPFFFSFVQQDYPTVA